VAVDAPSNGPRTPYTSQHRSTAAPLSVKARTLVPCPSFDANGATIYGGVSESSRRILTGIQGVESTAPKRSSPVVVMPCRRWTSPAGKAPTAHQRDVPEARDHEERRWRTLRPVVSPPRRSRRMKLRRRKSLPLVVLPFSFYIRVVAAQGGLSWRRDLIGLYTPAELGQRRIHGVRQCPPLQ
jgi:hypothetical protein